MYNCKSVAIPNQTMLKVNKRIEDMESFYGTIYRTAIGGLLFLANSIRPALMFPFSYASRCS